MIKIKKIFNCNLISIEENIYIETYGFLAEYELRYYSFILKRKNYINKEFLKRKKNVSYIKIYIMIIGTIMIFQKVFIYKDVLTDEFINYFSVFTVLVTYKEKISENEHENLNKILDRKIECKL